jgi:hypothetical protein
MAATFWNALRAWSTVPLIVLSVRSNEAEKVRLLERGADDYVVKPFGMAELLARAHAAMRRYVRVSTGEPVIRIGPLSIDLAARIVTILWRARGIFGNACKGLRPWPTQPEPTPVRSGVLPFPSQSFGKEAGATLAPSPICNKPKRTAVA